MISCPSLVSGLNLKHCYIKTLTIFRLEVMYMGCAYKRIKTININITQSDRKA